MKVKILIRVLCSSLLFTGVGCSEHQIPPITRKFDNCVINCPDVIAAHRHKQQIEDEPVDVNLDISESEITLKFNPYSVKVSTNYGYVNTYCPSIFSLYDETEVTMPAKIDNNQVSFKDIFSTKYQTFNITGLLLNKDATEGVDILGPECRLNIRIDNVELNETYGWDSPPVLITRQSLKDFDISDCGGFLCEIPGIKIPGLENSNINTSEFLNIFFNVVLYYKEYLNTGVSLNTTFNGGALSFLDSGDILSGLCTSNGKAMLEVFYAPSSIRYVPISDNQTKLFVNSSLTAGLNYRYIKEDWDESLEDEYRSKYYTPLTYVMLWYELHNSLASELHEGLNLYKTHIETLPNGNDIYLLSFDNTVAKKMMSVFVGLLKKSAYKIMFKKGFPKAKYSISEEELDQAINALPAIIDAPETRIKLGIQVCNPKQSYKPFGDQYQIHE